jgi:hypothetical protein
MLTVSRASAVTLAPLPPEETDGKVANMSGGISAEQASAMRRVASRYTLELEFLLTGEERNLALAYVPVTVRDRSGKVVLDRTSDGPLMLVQLPEGHYSVTASNTGKTETREVKIERGHHKTVIFSW